MAHLFQTSIRSLLGTKSRISLSRGIHNFGVLQTQFKSLNSTINPASDQFKANKNAYREKELTYQQLLGLALAAGGEKGIQRHTQVILSHYQKVVVCTPQNRCASVGSYVRQDGIETHSSEGSGSAIVDAKFFI